MKGKSKCHRTLLTSLVFDTVRLQSSVHIPAELKSYIRLCDVHGSIGRMLRTYSFSNFITLDKGLIPIKPHNSVSTNVFPVHSNALVHKTSTVLVYLTAQYRFMWATQNIRLSSRRKLFEWYKNLATDYLKD